MRRKRSLMSAGRSHQSVHRRHGRPASDTGGPAHERRGKHAGRDRFAVVEPPRVSTATAGRGLRVLTTAALRPSLTSEVAPLRRPLLHPPGPELRGIGEYAGPEHHALSAALRELDVEVLHLQELV